jgi:hypothetical protein
MGVKSTFWIHTIKASAGLRSVDRINEVLFGLIMVLTFTCSISAATSGHEELRTVLWSALGCNVAWGLVDAFMFLFSVLLVRGEMFSSVRTIRTATSQVAASEAVKETLPPFISQILTQEQVDYLKKEIKKLPEPPKKIFSTAHDLRQALLIFLIVSLSTFPVTLPFLLIHDLRFAMRVSNAVALLLLFFTGIYLAKQTGQRKVLTGIAFAFIGSVLVAFTMALGG